MALLKSTRTAQYPLFAYFTFNTADTMVDTSGVTKDFQTFGTSIVCEPIPLPPGAIVVGGDVTTETAITGSTAYNVSVGDSVSATRYLGATDKTTAARTALVPTGYVGLGENIRVTVAPTVANATAGKVTVRVEYIINNRANETVIV